MFHQVLCHAQLNGFHAARRLDGFGNLFNAFGGGVGYGNDGRGLTFRLVDGLLAQGLRFQDHLFLLAFCYVDRTLLFAFGVQNGGALFALRLHLLFHRHQNGLRRRDVLDFVAEHLHAPASGGFVDGSNYGDVDVSALLKALVQHDFTDFRTHGGLGQLGHGKHEVADPVGSQLRFHYLVENNAVDGHLYVVFGDAHLFRNVRSHLFQGVFVRNSVHKRNDDVQTGTHGAVVLAQAFHDVRGLLRHHLGAHEDHQNEEDDEGNG